ncbi:MAG: hypothetical protein ACI4JW_09555 [Oscillospiraceae bacterium]
MSKKKLHNYLPNLIISLPLTFVLMGLSMLLIISSVLLDPKTYTNSMHKVGVEDIAFEEIMTYCDRQYGYTGVEPETLKKSISKEEVSSAVYGYVEDTFEYICGRRDELPEFEMSFELLEKNVSDDYVRWADEEGVEFTQELEDIKQNTIKNAEQAIESDLDVMLLSYINKPNGISTKIRNSVVIVKKAQIILAAAAIVLLGIMAAVNRKRIGGMLYWIGVSLFSSSMLIMVPCLILKFTKYYDGLAIGSDSVYKALTRSMYGATDSVIKFSAITLAAAAVFMILFAVTLNIKPKKKSAAEN